ncbi:SGNH hydrolase-like domain-containing protein, acetyltransferase AlgX [Pseudobutyrivibrio sp. UC1225]|uniref:alginate O-acetyltransferase AlgX-related protein n=1 Tax=Pseudobutyrivibrio sp. UC1225 TaxID=1798185 RepID=UPI0008E40519|nr:hypothetical protein [Pseudobutyrivibrio sp. UC1225]SFO26494.1 SGNH hydrolase-like domain-containing protein, acetyltransferase AlgX [Pseudobutyrivibrio sp. UC1225]
MEKINAKKNHWYIYVLILTILIISIASWIYSAIRIGGKVQQKQSAKTNTTTMAASNTTNSSNGEELVEKQSIFELIDRKCNKFDEIVDKIDSKWSLYKNSEFSNVDSLVTYSVLGEVSSVQVFSGNDRWLFYKSKSDGDSIADYEGTNRYSQDEINNITESALLVQKEMEARGIKFTIMVAPNKENVYSEYMPNTYTKAEVTSTDILIDNLKSKGINVVSPKNNLLNDHLVEELYYHYDTHWNQLGAYIGVRDSLAALDISIPELTERKITSKPLKENYHYCAEDDLAKLAGLKAVLSDDVEYEVEGTLPVDWTSFKEEQETEQVSHFHNDNAENKSTILLVGDSFRSSMIPELREQFEDVYVLHRSFYKANLLDEISPDYVIAEYVERYSCLMKDICDLIEVGRYN